MKDSLNEPIRTSLQLAMRPLLGRSLHWTFEGGGYHCPSPSDRVGTRQACPCPGPVFAPSADRLEFDPIAMPCQGCPGSLNHGDLLTLTFVEHHCRQRYRWYVATGVTIARETIQSTAHSKTFKKWSDSLPDLVLRNILRTSFTLKYTKQRERKPSSSGCRPQ